MERRLSFGYFKKVTINSSTKYQNKVSIIIFCEEIKDEPDDSTTISFDIDKELKLDNPKNLILPLYSILKLSHIN